MNRIWALLAAILAFTVSPVWAIQNVQNTKSEDVIIPIAGAALIKTIPGSAASFSPQDDLLLVTDSGNTIIYETATWQEIKRISGTSRCISPDQEMLAVYGKGSLTFFNLTGKQVTKSYGDRYISFDKSCRMATVSSYAEVTSNDAKVTILNTATGEIIKQIRGWMGKLSPNGRVLAVNRYTSSAFSASNQVLAYDTATWQMIDSYNGFVFGFADSGKTLTTEYPTGQNYKHHDISSWAGNITAESVQKAKPDSIRQLIIDDKNKLITVYDARMLAVKKMLKKGEFESTAEYSERMSKWRQDYSLPVTLGSYDADRKVFAASIAGEKVFINVPREKAIALQGHKTLVHVEGKLIYHDAENIRLTNAVLIDEVTKERFILNGIGAPPKTIETAASLIPTVATVSINAIPDFKIAPRPNDIAIVIGIENYQGIPKSDHSGSDAELVKEYMRALGFAQRNIVLILNERATKSRIETAIEGWLPNRVKNDSRIVFYYSGHGAPEPKTGEAYIVPFDGDPNYLATSGYPLKRLYEKLGALKVHETIIILDSCFSGSGGRSVLAKGARPLVMVKDTVFLSRNMVVLTATQGSQISSSSPEKMHGIFTYYFLKALQDGKRTIVDIYQYIKPLIEDEARSLNVEQSPNLNPPHDKLAGRFILRK